MTERAKITFMLPETSFTVFSSFIPRTGDTIRLDEHPYHPNRSNRWKVSDVVRSYAVNYASSNLHYEDDEVVIHLIKSI